MTRAQYDRAEMIETLSHRVFQILKKKAGKTADRFVAANSVQVAAWMGWTGNPDFAAIRRSLEMLCDAGLITPARSKDAKNKTVRGYIVNEPPTEPEPIDVAPTEFVLTPKDVEFLRSVGVAVEQAHETAGHR
jgi:hypothetical protein